MKITMTWQQKMKVMKNMTMEMVMKPVMPITNSNMITMTTTTKMTARVVTMAIMLAIMII